MKYVIIHQNILQTVYFSPSLECQLCTRACSLLQPLSAQEHGQASALPWTVWCQLLHLFTTVSPLNSHGHWGIRGARFMRSLCKQPAGVQLTRGGGNEQGDTDILQIAIPLSVGPKSVPDHGAHPHTGTVSSTRRASQHASKEFKFETSNACDLQ